MRTRLATILAAHPEQDALIAQHDRCAQWLSANKHIIRDRFLLTGEEYGDTDRICTQIEEFAKTGKLDLLVAESLSVFGQDGLRILELIEFLQSNNVRLICLKEGQDLAAVALFETYCENQPSEAVYFGEFGTKERIQSWADALGWTVQMPHRRKELTAKYFQNRLAQAQGKVLIIEGLRMMPENTRAACFRRLCDLKASGQRYFLFHEGLDSLAPNHITALRGAVLSFEDKPQTPTLPDPNVLLIEWANRKLKREKSSISSYLDSLSVNSKIFFHLINKFLGELDNYTDIHGIEAAAVRFKVPLYAAKYGLEWYARRASRSHSSAPPNS